jgi:hypothetical protein
MCSFLVKDIIKWHSKLMVDNEISLLNKMLNDEVRDVGENWGILYHVDYYQPDTVLYYTNDQMNMRAKVLKLLSAYYRNEYSFNMPNIILFKVIDINPQLVTLDLLDRIQSEYYYIIKNCKFNKSINHMVPFLIGAFAGVIQIMVDYAFVFERNVSRKRLIAFYKEKTGATHVKWHKTIASMRGELAKCKFYEIWCELERISV